MPKSKSAALAVLVATSAAASAGSLSGSAITDLVAGAVIEIHTPLGTKLPVHYSRQGRLTGRAGNGSIASYLGAASDGGRWWVASDQLCHKWDRWFDGEVQCMRLAAEGGMLHWRRPDGTSGTAAIASREPAPAHAVAGAARAEPREGVRPSFSALAEVRQTQAVQASKPAAAPPAMTASSSAAAATAEPAGEPAPRVPAARSPPAKPGPPPAAEKAAAAPTASAPSAKEPTVVATAGTAKFRVANVATSDVLNVREGPSTDHPSVGALPAQSTGVAIVGACRALWCPISHGAISGWVNRRFLADGDEDGGGPRAHTPRKAARTADDNAEAPRSCLTREASLLLDRIEARFGPVEVISTCRQGARIAGTGRPSRHASGNAIDFNAGSRKAEVIEWLLASHRGGGLMTYPGMDHIHVDVGPPFVALADGRRRRGGRDWAAHRMGLRAIGAATDEAAPDRAQPKPFSPSQRK